MGLSKKLHTTSYSLFTGIFQFFFFFIERMKIKTAGIDRHRKWENEGGGGDRRAAYKNMFLSICLPFSLASLSNHVDRTDLGLDVHQGLGLRFPYNDLTLGQ